MFPKEHLFCFIEVFPAGYRIINLKCAEDTPRILRGTIMKGGIAFITVEITADKAKKLALWLETNDTLAKYGLTVEDSSTSKIAATAKPKAAPAPKK